MRLESFHDRLDQAVSHALDYLLKGYFAELDPTPIQEKFQYDGVAYETSKEAHAPIAFLRGRTTKKYAHVTIYRMKSGRYELTVYVL